MIRNYHPTLTVATNRGSKPLPFSVWWLEGAWSIVDGSEIRPVGAGAARRDWDERNRKAIQLISSSVSAPFQPSITDGIRNEDAQAMWTDLAKEDRANNKTHQANLFFQFNQAV